MEFILHELVSVSIYSVLGVFLMLLGSFLVDLVIPCSFPEEIKKGNTAIGWISARCLYSSRSHYQGCHIFSRRCCIRNRRIH
jgi:Domain of Unknown Function (DUF350).